MPIHLNFILRFNVAVTSGNLLFFTRDRACSWCYSTTLVSSSQCHILPSWSVLVTANCLSGMHQILSTESPTTRKRKVTEWNVRPISMSMPIESRRWLSSWWQFLLQPTLIYAVFTSRNDQRIPPYFMHSNAVTDSSVVSRLQNCVMASVLSIKLGCAI